MQIKGLTLKAAHAAVLCGSLLCLGSAAIAQQDSMPPQLVSIKLSPAQADVSSTAVRCKIDLTLKDDLSGVLPSNGKVTYWAIELRSPSGRQERVVFNTQLKLTSGTPLDGVWTGEFTMPRFSEPGVWSVSTVSIPDAAGHSLLLRRSNTEHSLDNASMSVVSEDPDVTPPQVQSVEFAPAPSNANNPAPRVQVRVRATDDSSGVDMTPDGPNGPSDGMVVELKSPSGNQTTWVHIYRKWTLLQGTPRDGVWQADLQFPKNSEAGTWTVTRVSIKDAARNIQHYIGPSLRDILVIESVAIRQDASVAVSSTRHPD